MSKTQSHKTYLDQQVMTASPATLVAMLYDKAIISLREAIEAIEAGDIQRRWEKNNRAVEIITHMWTTLDRDQGGEVADKLSELFRFILKQLLEVDFKNDADAARGVIVLLEPLRDSWRQLAKSGGQANAPADANGQPAPGTGSFSVSA